MAATKLSKDQAREEVERLVERYEALAASGKVKSYNEEMTKKDFILPLFRALGWSVEDGEEVTAEEKVSRKRVDYGFRIDGIPKFFLEAKALKEDLDNVRYVEQAINYAWHKGCTWAVLTDFEGVKVFNAEWKSANPLQNQFFGLSCHQYSDDFERLWLLSRESFEGGTIDGEAEKWGKKAKKVPVDKQLLTDLTGFRELLSKNILKNNASRDLSADELDEAVQRIIDRLIFLRTLEDRQLEAPMLQSLLREDAHKRIDKKLTLLFRSIDEVYDSKLFGQHLCEELVIDDDVLKRVIGGLFRTSDGSVHYDFGAIDADVLGNIYEQYLGHILKKTEKRAKLSEGKAHRKEQGIYYTPTYVVDYIVKNTVGELAKDKKVDLSRIRVLDPACGSGSFLMKAFDYLVTLDRKRHGEEDQMKLDLTGETATYGRKVEILKNNIYGVDLDPKAVEIAQLNLLLKAAEKKHRLPMLQENIKVGNSLIDDATVAGTRAFRWEEEFKDVMDEGGFDVVIGNPPYVNVYLMNDKERIFFSETAFYETPHLKYDLYTIFIEKGIKLLRDRGHIGLIVPYSLLTQPYAELLRKYILDHCCIVSIVDLSNYFVFQEATVKTIILILKKEKNITIRNKNKIKIIRQESYSGSIDSTNKYLVEQLHFMSTHQHMFRLEVNKRTLSISDKMDNLSVALGSICYVSKGIVAYSRLDERTKDDFLHDRKINPQCVRYLEGKDVEKYSIHYKGIYLDYNRDIMSRPTFPELHENNKILVRAMSNSLLATFDNNRFYADQKLICCSRRSLIEKYVKASKISKQVLADNADKYNEKYIVGLLNSSLMWYYYKSLIFGGLSIHPEDIRNLPIRKIDFSILNQVNRHDSIVNLVDKMLALKQKVNIISDKLTDERSRIEKDIKKLDQEIDQEVYHLYGLTEEEIKIVENSLK